MRSNEQEVRLKISSRRWDSPTPKYAERHPAPAGTMQAKPIPVEIHQPPQPVLDTTLAIIRPLISPLATTGLIILFLFFILAQREDLRDRFLRLAGTGDLQRTTVALDDAGERLSKFFIIQGLLNTGFGIFIGVALWMLGLPNPVLWGLLAGLMRFVPFIGSVIASVFPVILAAAIDPGWTPGDQGTAFCLSSPRSWQAKSSSRCSTDAIRACPPSLSSSPRFSGRCCGVRSASSSQRR